ncbi:Transcription initiation factor TFIID subunit 4 [Bagarius yarrelli]|uniref:Transcription initiation factor TFIID subunit 4 n=1 Tax=Bagarius yarrelli TaxID=175774 RepID=A0A556TNI8_BAGYA|nr:Transcription initiation factor TFIID subunit 4 [Bagarius yarrelli]
MAFGSFVFLVQHDRGVTAIGSLILPLHSSASGSASGSAGASSSSTRQVRQRITRVNLRDLIFCLEQERPTARSLLLYKALLK